MSWSSAVQNQRATRAGPLGSTMMPQSVARFRIVRKLGAGGMAEVYLADDPTLDRQVALKVLSPATTLDETARQRLIREAQAAARLEHPNVCAIYEVGEDQGHVYFAMQYIDGEMLANRIARGPVAADEVLRIASEARLFQPHRDRDLHSERRV
jgi:serine/threonine protein kinase